MKFYNLGDKSFETDFRLTGKIRKNLYLERPNCLQSLIVKFLIVNYGKDQMPYGIYRISKDHDNFKDNHTGKNY